MSKRGEQWTKFSGMVLDHVENYTVPQYGDFPHDQAEGFSIPDIVLNIRRYLNRAESNARGRAEAKRDCLKIAHYACLLYLRIEKETPLNEKWAKEFK